MEKTSMLHRILPQSFNFKSYVGKRFSDSVFVLKKIRVVLQVMGSIW